MSKRILIVDVPEQNLDFEFEVFVDNHKTTYLVNHKEFIPPTDEDCDRIANKHRANFEGHADAFADGMRWLKDEMIEK